MITDADHVAIEAPGSWSGKISFDFHPIHVEEAVALSRTLVALGDKMCNRCVEVWVDSRVLFDWW